MFSYSYDFVELTDSLGQTITEQLSGFMAGFNITVEGKRTQLLTVKFTSDSSFTERGFLAQFRIGLGEYPCFKVPRGQKDKTKMYLIFYVIKYKKHHIKKKVLMATQQTTSILTVLDWNNLPTKANVRILSHANGSISFQQYEHEKPLQASKQSHYREY